MVQLQLAALLCSRLCHDLVGPVGALNNGLEILAEEQDVEMRAQATALLGDSATEASRRLQFFRLAFGAGGGRGPTLALGEARKAAQGLFNKGRISLDWPAGEDPVTLDKRAVKLLLNLVLLGTGTLPRGGVLSVRASAGDSWELSVAARGPGARIESEVSAALTQEMPADLLDTHNVIAYYAGALAADLGCRLSVVQPDASEVVFAAAPVPPGSSGG